MLNFRGLPQTSMEFQAAVGMSLEDVLAELSAPCGSGLRPVKIRSEKRG